MAEVKQDNKKFAAGFLYVAVFTVVTVVLWIGFEVFRSLTSEADQQVASKQELAPLSSKINMKGLEAVKKRRFIPQTELDSLEVINLTPTIVESKQEEGTESASLNESEQKEATESGEI